MDIDMKDNSKMGEEMEREYFYGEMELGMRENLRTLISMDME